MLPDFHIVSIDLHAPEENDWTPADPRDCEVWATVNVGDHRGGAFYQVHVCTHQALPRIDNKRYCFTIAEYRDVQDLAVQMNAFIEEQIGFTPDDPYLLLSKHWLWEHESNPRE